jgi:uncharacterized protein with ParB-like and HNH nuclease domain
MISDSKSIECGKIKLMNVFGNYNGQEMWYRIPDYQRPYVWQNEQISVLLDDVSYAAIHSTDAEYFLGSIVLHAKKSNSITDNEVLDGQQRLTTLFMLMAVLRDLTKNPKLKRGCQENIHQEEDEFKNIPERFRVEFDVRKGIKDFINNHIKKDDGTLETAALKAITEDDKDEGVSVKNMAAGVVYMHKWFEANSNISVEIFYKFLMQNVILIYVASKELEDAFRLFTVLNDRGIKLRNSDILKAQNLKEITDDTERKKYAEFWQELENELGDDFDLFLSYTRTILVKEKARLALLKEFERNIYRDDEQKKVNGKSPLLKRGKDTFDLLRKYRNHYNEIFSGNNHHINKDWAFDNLITIMKDTSLSDAWIPPLLAYRETFGEHRILAFLRKLDNTSSGNWIARESPTKRLEAMSNILKKIDKVNNDTTINTDASLNKSAKITAKVNLLFNSTVFDFNKTELFNQLENSTVYGRRYQRYILYKLDYIYANNSSQKTSIKNMSVEHLLPRTPKDNSQWKKDFTDIERATWTNKLGNLVMISRRKNSSQGRLDYDLKRDKYFKNNIEIFPNSIRIWQNYPTWTMTDLKNNHDKVLNDLKTYYNK